MSDNTQKKIGILGGSFNPPHEGHIHISKKAIKLLALDEVWWVVSPQNPLKSSEGMESFDKRFKMAEEITKDEENIIISDYEVDMPTTYTFNTLFSMKGYYRSHKFIWLMGADNIENFPKWHRWEEIMYLMPIAIMDRDNFASNVTSGEFYEKFGKFQVSLDELKEELAKQASLLPKWAFLRIEKHPLSSTKIRENLRK